MAIRFDESNQVFYLHSSNCTGVNTFVLDDGWFGKRNSDCSGLGDWFVNEEKLGSTLKDFIDLSIPRGCGSVFGSSRRW